MQGVFLDAATLVPDLKGATQMTEAHWDISPLPLANALTNIQYFTHTATDQVVERSQNAEVIISNKVVLTDDLMTQLPKLKLICIAATGTNNVDLEAAENRGIAVTNVAGYSTQSVVQICFTLIMALQSKLLPLQSELKQKPWSRHSQFVFLPQPFSELSGKTLGIIGYGTIGKAVAQVAQSFGLKVLIGQLPNRPQASHRLSLNELLPRCDIVSLHCPQTEETAKLVDDAFLSMMKPEALLINTARGGLVDERALANALKSHQIGGAGLDVLSVEPPERDNPLLDGTLHNLIITPHLAWASKEARQRLIDGLAENIIAFEQQRKINRVV